MRPTDLLDAAKASHDRLLVGVAELTDDDVRAPSLLPKWSRAHVIAHLARNADSHVWLFEGAVLGEVRQQYPSAASRKADIEEGSSLSADELLSDLTNSCRALETAWADLDDDLFETVQKVSPGTRTMTEIVFRRLREVEIHHVDLGLTYIASDWPEIYVEDELGRQLHRLPDRASHVALVEWLVGRGDPPVLEPW
jgi:maleylpyruvate isomerase